MSIAGLPSDDLAALRTRAKSDPKAAIKAAAKQFEAMFVQQLMKSMRESTQASGMFDNEGTAMGNEMLDAQYAKQMSGQPGGLADVIARQLERQTTGAAAPAGAANAPQAGGSVSSTALQPSQADFVNLHESAARAAEAQSGIPAAFMIAQAAHESGWGKRQILNADGSSAHNLFGIKAGAGWSGKTTNITTTEVVDGQPRKVVAAFRAYGSDADAFRDYAQMMKDSPRYASVIAAGNDAQGFAQSLQRAGYATDPAYADKLSRVINTTLRLQRATTNSAGGNAT